MINLSTEALRKLLEDAYRQGPKPILINSIREIAMNNFITSQLLSIEEEEKKMWKLVARLVELKPYHMMPYNLGDMGEMGQIIDKLQKLIPSSHTSAMPEAGGVNDWPKKWREVLQGNYPGGQKTGGLSEYEWQLEQIVDYIKEEPTLIGLGLLARVFPHPSDEGQPAQGGKP